MDENTDFTGSPAEFLSLRDADDSPSPADDIPTPDPQQAAAEPADATDDPAAEDDDLSPEDRVAAVLAQDADYVAQYGDPTAIAEPDAAEAQAEDGDEEDAAETADDLDGLSPEEMRALAEEALRLRAEQAASGSDAEQQALVREIAELDGRVVQTMQQRYEQTVIATSEAHYSGIMAQRLADLREQAQRYDDPDAWYAANMQAVIRPVQRAQRQWEAKQAAEWEPHIAAAIDAARKQHPALRKLWAEQLVAERSLPKKAVEELLKVTNTDDMAVVADALVASVKAHAKTKRQANQEKREAAAKAAPVLSAPATGRPRAAKPVELKGDEREWLAMRRAFAKV